MLKKNIWEFSLWNKKELCCGIDEAGRGSLFGPVVVGGVILPPSPPPDFIIDSKLLSEKKRDFAYKWIIANCISIAVIISHKTIDKYNIYQATKRGMIKTLSLMQSHLKIQENWAHKHNFSKNSLKTALIDAMPLSVENLTCVSIIHGELYSSSIAAASIVAKVTRDRLMNLYESTLFTKRKFSRHKGYGTLLHKKELFTFGSSILHRKSFHFKEAPTEKNTTQAPKRKNVKVSF